jgi:hypothetical protein
VAAAIFRSPMRFTLAKETLRSFEFDCEETRIPLT